MIVGVVGASGGIGGECVRLLAPRHTVLGIDARPDTRCGAHAFLHLRLDSEAATSEAVDFCVNGPFGLVDAMVFAAGSYRRRPIGDYAFDELTATFWDNIFSVFLLCRGVLPHMVSRGCGKLIFIASQAAVLGGLDGAYAASKGALQSLMKSLAREYGPHGVTCNSVSPGPVETEMAGVMGPERKRILPRKYTVALPHFS